MYMSMHISALVEQCIHAKQANQISFFFNKISTFLDQRLLCVRAQVPVEFGPSLT